jgi:Tfp pilus assembly protein PilE
MRATRYAAGFTVVELAIVKVIFILIGIIGIATFNTFQARSKLAEAKANLRALYTSELAFLQEKDVFSTSPEKIGFEPERANRYQYNLVAWSRDHLEDRSGPLNVQHPDDDGIARDTFKYFQPAPQVPVAARLPQVNPGPVGAMFIGGALGWVDEGATPDVWTIASFDQPARVGGVSIPAGTPYHDQLCSTCTAQ